MRETQRTSFFSPRRVLIIAGSTVTQLVRMKVFYFLIPVALLFLGLQFFDGFWYDGPETMMPEQELRMHKNLCLGTMMFFTSLFAIVATALLIPSDVEDRTLYTILCKPVPRLDYLVGKLAGVIFVLFVSMVVMNLLLVTTLHGRTEAKLVEMTAYMESVGFPDEEVAAGRAEIAAHGPTLGLQYGVLAHFFKACVIAAVALLISTFSTSTLFTIATSVMVWVIGAFQAIMREGVFSQLKGEEDLTMADQILNGLVSVVFPDFQLYEGIADAAARAEAVMVMDVARLGGLTAIYLGIYVVLSWFVFADKEF